MQSKNGGWPQRLYVIGERGFGPVKIGIAERPLYRLEALRCSGDTTLLAPGVRRRELQVLYSQPGGRPVERALHTHFADRAIVGEWFDLGPDPVRTVREAIDALYERGKIGMNASSAVIPPIRMPRTYRDAEFWEDGKKRVAELIEQQRRAREVKLCPPRVLVYPK